MKFRTKSKAYKSKSKKIMKRKVYRRKKFNPTSQLSNYTKIGLGFPKKLVVTHRYCENVVLSTPTGALADYKFRANGMYDPNYSTTGHQPMYFDQLSALYNHYTVIGSKIKVRWTPATTNATACLVGILLQDDLSTSVTNASSFYEQAQVYGRHVIPYSVVRPYVSTAKFSAKKVFGGNVMSNPRLEGTNLADPTELTYFQLFMQPIDGGTNVSLYAEVEITYIAVWKEVKDMAGS